MPVAQLTRKEFTRAFCPPPSEHVTVLGVTGSGKSTLIGQLLSLQGEENLVLVIDTKPRNPELDSQLKSQGYRITERFPPPFPKWRLTREKKWILRVKHTGDPDHDNIVLYDALKQALPWLYLNAATYGGCVVVVDEIADILACKLRRPGDQAIKFVNHLWTHGRAMKVAVWAGTQRPRSVPILMLSQPTHYFYGKTAIEDDLKRYAETGGLPKGAMLPLVAELDRFEFLYICQNPLGVAKVLSR